MPTKCTITGTVVAPDGLPVALAQIEFGSAKVRPMTPLTIAPESATATTDETGALTVELYPGEYSVRALKTGRQRYPTFSITVPETSSAVLADIIDLPPPVSLDAAGQAVLAAQHLRDEAAGFAADAEVAEFEAGDASGQAIDAAGVALGAAGVATGKAGEAADSAAAALAAEGSVASNAAIAEAAALLADARADDAASFAGFRDYKDVAALLANTSLSYSAGAQQVAIGDIIRTRAEGFSYQVAAAGATDHHIMTTGGVRLYRLGAGILFQRGNKDYLMVAGVLRNNAGTWEFLDDSGHVPLGVDGVSVVGDEIIINYTSLGAGKVVTWSLSSDERFVRDGIHGGASVGKTEARIRIGAPLNFWVNVDTQAVTTSPWWAGDVTVAIVDDCFEITHPSVDTSIYLTTDRIGAATSRQIEMGQTRESTTKTRIYPRTDIYGYLSYNGTAWDESFINADFRAAISVAFAGGELVVTHPSNGGDYDLTLSGRQPYMALGDSFGSTNFQVQFWNPATGAQVMVQDTNMRFYFNRKNIKPINAGAINIPVGSWAFKAPVAWLKDPNKLTTALSNFWFEGKFER